MHITANTTGMLAGLTVATDKDACDHCVVVIKGTFQTSAGGAMTLVEAQQPLVTADEHYGDPAFTCVRYESDFALEKPQTDVIVVGKAVAPPGRCVTKLAVRLEVQGRRKELTVYGDRRWTTTLGMVGISDPVPFAEIPITFDRAWGGFDDSRGPDQVVVEPRNPVGVGFHPHRSRARMAGLPVPNIEQLGRAIASPRDYHEPVGFGCVGRVWQPRVTLAGTYDKRWRDERAPYLPADFDTHYFQCAPLDQQFPHFQGGERICCIHMAEQELVEYVLPSWTVPVRFRFCDAEAERTAVLDTVILEPHLFRATLVWRASVPLRKKLTALRDVLVGDLPKCEGSRPVGYRNGKPSFAGLADAIRWLRQRREGRS